MEMESNDDWVCVTPPSSAPIQVDDYFSVKPAAAAASPAPAPFVQTSQHDRKRIGQLEADLKHERAQNEVLQTRLAGANAERTGHLRQIEGLRAENEQHRYQIAELRAQAVMLAPAVGGGLQNFAAPSGRDRKTRDRRLMLTKGKNVPQRQGGRNGHQMNRTSFQDNSRGRMNRALR